MSVGRRGLLWNFNLYGESKGMENEYLNDTGSSGLAMDMKFIIQPTVFLALKKTTLWICLIRASIRSEMAPLRIQEFGAQPYELCLIFLGSNCMRHLRLYY
jgi:hypothetical protein